jgi:uncharacterized membrane protein YcgQ (UPF0703/DUF1980 family)
MMKLKNLFKINFEKLFQMIILVFLFNCVFNLVIRQTLSMYIHPRMNYLIYFSLFVIILFILFPLTKISSKGGKRFIKLKYFPFLFLLSLFYFIPKDFIQSDIANLRGVKIGNSTNIYKNDIAGNASDVSMNADISINESNFIDTVNNIYNSPSDFINKSITIKGYIFKSNDMDQDQFVVIQYDSSRAIHGLLCTYKKSEVIKLKNKQKIELKGTLYSKMTKYKKEEKIPIIKVDYLKMDPDAQPGNSSEINILIDESNFLDTIDSIYKDQDDYANKNITITGFIFRSKEFNRDQFIVGRMAMFCCAADASVCGLLCTSIDPDVLTLKDKQWVEIQGNIHSDLTDFSDGKKLPIIQVNNFKLIQAPKDEYVFYQQY